MDGRGWFLVDPTTREPRAGPFDTRETAERESAWHEHDSPEHEHWDVVFRAALADEVDRELARERRWVQHDQWYSLFHNDEL